MFRKWLSENNIKDYDLTKPLYPKASDREFWSTKIGADAVKAAEKYLGYNWPLVRATQFMEFEISGNRTAQENPHFARRNALAALILGELAEYNGRFLPDIVDGLFAICEESYWGLSAHKAYYGHKSTYLPNMNDPFIDLFAAETAATLAVINYLFKDAFSEFCPDISARIEYELEHKIIRPYLIHTDWFWMGYNDIWVNNWNPWIMSNLLTVFLLGEKRETVLYDGVGKLIFEIQRFYDCMPSDGGCDEGATYWGVAGGALFEFLEQLCIASDEKISFWNDEKLRAIVKFAELSYIGKDYCANFADGGTKAAQSPYILYTAGKRFSDESLMSLAKQFKCAHDTESPRLRRTLFELICTNALDSLPDYQPPEESILPVLENSFVRAGEWYYAAKGGHNSQSHNHNDVGSFIAYYENEPVLVDPSCGVYTKKTFSPERYEIWTMQSGWHNLPVINSTEQKDGLEFAADAFSLTEKRTDISFAKAYPAEAYISSLTRSIDAECDGIEIFDKFDFLNKTNVLTENFICVSEPTTDGKRVIIDNRFVLESDVPAEISIDSVCFDGDAKLTNMWNSDKLYRVHFTFDCADKAAVKFNLRRLEK